jgi:hypothetical protein
MSMGVAMLNLVSENEGVEVCEFGYGGEEMVFRSRSSVIVWTVGKEA